MQKRIGLGLNALYAVNDAATELVNICDVQLKTAGGAGVFKEVLARIHGH